MEYTEYDSLLELISDICREMDDIFQSGFATVHKSSVARIQELSKVSESYGLHTAAQMLEKLSEMIDLRRHSINFDDGKIMDIMCQINRYLEICEKRIKYENILANYTQRCDDNINN